jgi:hypothetical protein
MTTMRAYQIYQKFSVREKFSFNNVKNGHTNAPIRFFTKESARQMSDTLNIAIAHFGVWDDAFEMRNGDLVMADELKKYEFEPMDFSYVAIETIDETMDDS